MDQGHQTGLLDRLETGMKRVAAAGLMGMALVTGVDVVGRAVWNLPVFGSEEVVSALAVLVVGFSLPYAHSQGSHIGVELLVERFGRTARETIKAVTDLLGAALFGIVAWRMVEYGLDQMESGVLSMNLALPMYPLLFVLAGCFVVFALLLARDGLRAITRSRR